MKKIFAFTIITTLFCVANTLSAQESKDSNESEIILEKINYVAATTIDFQKEFDVGFPSLLTLGVRIEQSDNNADPVSLVAAGLELKAAELAADKTVDNYKSEDVLKRGVELALIREEIAELKAIKFLLPEQSETLDKAIKVIEAAKEEQSRHSPHDHGRWQDNQSSRYSNRITINNTRHNDAHVYINGRYYGYIQPKRSSSYYPHDSRGNIEIRYRESKNIYRKHGVNLGGYINIR
ncbi:MAG: hypothetical protein LBB88_11525 [Planctomycetaceae bacterium]|jgi:hypothetical protein|nr:hypothetical protein [Planctomycetaceae bacterium]